MRKGQNPAKFVKEVATPEKITLAVLNFIPFQSGFYAETLDVLMACLNSARTDAGLPFDLLVFDNGSCEEVQDALLAEQRAGRIQQLYLSEQNLGKGGAWNIIFGGAPGEYIVYADADVLFYPGWLAKSVELLETFPNVGMVTARPYRMRDEVNTATVAWAESNPNVSIQRGQLMSWEDYSSFVYSLGNSEAQAREWYTASEDVRITYKGVTAQVGASHWQFLTRKETMQPFLPFSMTRPMGQVRQLDERMNAAGLLRLMPDRPYAQNMSNSLPAELKGRPTTAPAERASRGLYDAAPVKRLLLSLYDRIFKIYYGS